MGFLNPFFLVGALAAGLPILVHLVRRTRSVRLPFSSLMFLRRIEQKTIRRRKLRNLLLLALRCAALLFLALAFARPYFSGNSGKAAASTDTRTVILVDTSYSMRYPGVFDRAIQAARGIVQKSGPGAEIGLVAFSGSYQILRKLRTGKEEITSLLGSVQAGLGTTDYLQAVQAADSMLKEGGTGPGVIYLISDFHQTGWNRDTPLPRLSSGAKLIAIDVGDKSEENLAVTQVTAEPVVYAQKYSAKVLATVADYQPAPPTAEAPAGRAVTVELRINDLASERRPIQVAPGASQTIEFSGFNLLEGTNRLSVEIDGDNFPLDNRYFFTIKRESQTKVLAMEAAVRGRSESFYLKQSLLAGNDSPYELTVKTPGSVNPSDLGQYRVII
ncbi:MAG: BatA domain-containing protein, partial [Blastocatellia bacterium]